MSGVICCAPAGIRFGGTVTSGPRGRGGQPGRGRRLEQRPHRHRQAPLAQPLDQLHREQRVPAQGEEVVLRPDPLQAQDLGEHRADDLLRAPSPGPGRRPAGVVRGGQRRLSIFPFGVSGSASSTVTEAGTM